MVIGQIEHLSGQAKDWVWSTNELTELIGSQPIEQEEISLDETMKEFNQMVNVQHTDAHTDHPETTVIETVNPTWPKLLNQSWHWLCYIFFLKLLLKYLLSFFKTSLKK